MKDTPATDPRFDPRFQRGYRGSEPVVAPATTPDPDASPGHDEVLDESWAPTPRNPYRIALLLAGVAMLLGAGILIWYSVQTANDTSGFYDVGQQTLSDVEYLVPPALILSGLVCIIAWLVLGALAARDAERG
jgi:hypothetical protein